MATGEQDQRRPRTECTVELLGGDPVRIGGDLALVLPERLRDPAEQHPLGVGRLQVRGARPETERDHHLVHREERDEDPAIEGQEPL